MARITGPYKVVQTESPDARNQSVRYSIAKEDGQRGYLRTVVHDAGTGQTAAEVCTLLNESYNKRVASRLEEEKKEGGEVDETG